MAADRSKFYEILNDAIADLLINGFDSKDRLEHWLDRLSVAAQNALIPESVLERALRSQLAKVYERTVKTGSVMRRHPGIEAFTIERIKPSLRAELDRRILASASLIKLNRKASVQRTLQRFAGWATSIPIGGTEVAQREEAKKSIRRGIAGLPFEERRVIINQGHKLAAAINDIIARDGGAIILIWHHVMERTPGYQPRPEHVARNGVIFVLRDSWAIKAGLIKLDGHQYYDQVTAVGEEPFCRCFAQYRYNLQDVPEGMLTAKGRDELKRVRAQLRRA